jgi:hypothetical protein
MKNNMRILERDQWLSDPILKDWRFKSAASDKKCECRDKENWVELIDHESCIIGRIDTIVCTKCNEVESFRIIR